MSKTNEYKITKINADKKLVFGWANVSIRTNGEEVLDFDQDIMPIEILENAAYEFNLFYRTAGELHNQKDAVGILIESFIVTPEKLEVMGLASNALPLGWWVGFKIFDQEVFDNIKNGTYSMFSIEGTARRDLIDG